MIIGTDRLEKQIGPEGESDQALLGLSPLLHLLDIHEPRQKKPVFGVYDQSSFQQACSATENS